MAAIGGVPEFPTSRGVPAAWAAGPRAASGPRSRRLAGCPGVERPAAVRTAAARGPAFRLGEARPAPIRSQPIRRDIAGGETAHREPPRRRGPAARQRRVRLTRRGRAVLLALLVAATAVAAILVASASRAADPAGPNPTAVVRPGDTLWSVAERHAPGRDPYGTIEEIRRLNGLADYTVQPGQELELPHR
jgi:LysM repeat protein